MSMKILFIGKGKIRPLHEAEAEFQKRISAFQKLSLEELSTRGKTPSKALSQAIGASDYLCILDDTGKAFNSKEFSRFISGSLPPGKKNLIFALGDAHGWEESVLKRADAVLSLSKLTFSYQVARVVLLEQIYRGLAIANGHPYHKD